MNIYFTSYLKGSKSKGPGGHLPGALLANLPLIAILLLLPLSTPHHYHLTKLLVIIITKMGHHYHHHHHNSNGATACGGKYMQRQF